MESQDVHCLPWFPHAAPSGFTWFGWFATLANQVAQDDAATSAVQFEEVAPDPVDNSEHLYDTAVDAPLGTVTVFTGAREGQKMPCQYGVAMVTGMPRFNTAFELPMPHDSWSPEAMITWM